MNTTVMEVVGLTAVVVGLAMVDPWLLLAAAGMVLVALAWRWSR